MNDMLRDIASRGVFVSAHPDVIDRMGTKLVLHRTPGHFSASSFEWRTYERLAAVTRVREAMRTQPSGWALMDVKNKDLQINIEDGDRAWVIPDWRVETPEALYFCTPYGA